MQDINLSRTVFHLLHLNFSQRLQNIVERGLLHDTSLLELLQNTSTRTTAELISHSRPASYNQLDVAPW